MKNWARLAFFVVAVSWGSSFAFQKVILGYIDAYSLTFWNFAVASVVLLVLVGYHQANLLYRWREGLVLGVLLAATEILQMIGLEHTSSANTAFITNMGMLFIPYAGWIIFKHRVSAVHNLALALAAIGMFLLVGGVRAFGYGDGMLLMSALSVALYFLYSQRFEGERSSHVLPLLVQQFFVTTILSACAVLFWGHGFAVPNQIQFQFGVQIIVFTVIPYMLVQWASRWTDEMVAAIYDGVVEPLVGGIISWVVFAEPTTTLAVCGGIMMVSAFALANVFAYKHVLLKRFTRFLT